ncbi:MAG: insulinase family protein [Candidatus Hydrogenedentes bacterium]|nr:insulinase family protein [Candidatus Hydrogenedentota bacterium]
MKNQKNLLAILAVLLLMGIPQAFGAYSQINQDNPKDPMKTSIYRLENGLTVYLTENHETPRFYVEIAVRAGSKMDPAESTGLAHYLEHMLFKGSKNFGTLDFEKEKPFLDRIEELYEVHFKETDPEKRKAIYAEINELTLKVAESAVPNELDNMYKSMGGNHVNAHTWHEETVYKVDLPSNRMEQWAILESERFLNPVFRLFQPELEAVYEEMNRALDNKDRIISYAVGDVLYKKHPYGQQPTLGLVEHLKNPSLKNITQFYNTWYVPNNMGIFISGDIDKAKTMAIIDQYFSTWESKPLPETAKWDEAPLQGREYVETKYEGEEYVLLAFRTAPLSHADAEALRLIDMILDNATAGLINLNLNQQQKVRGAGSYPEIYNDYGSQNLWGVPKEGQSLEEVEQLLRDQLEIIKNGEFDDWILPAIINDFKKTQKAGLESDMARVGLMRDAYLQFQDWDHAVAAFDRMEKITKDDIVRVAKTYFGGNYVAGWRKDAQHELPAIDKPELAKIEIDPTRRSPFAAQLLGREVKPIEPVFVDPGKDYTKAAADGITWYHAPNPVNDIFTLSLSVEKGTYSEKRLALAADLLQKSGTSRFSAEDLKKEWYKLGTDFGIGSSDNNTGMSLSGLDENFEASVALMAELLNGPVAAPGTLDEMKKIVLVERDDAKKQADSIAAALSQYVRYGAESAYLREIPSKELLTLIEEELFGAIKEILGYKRIVYYTGTLPLAQVQEVLNKYLPGADLKDTPPYHFQTVRKAEKTEILYHNKETAKANVRIEFGGAPFDEGINTGMQLYNSYFAGGMAGIVFQELREARGLAYMAGARYVPGGRQNDQDIMVGVIQTQNDKTNDALEAFVDLFDNLPESEERFAISRESLISGYRTGKIGFRGVCGAVREWELQGLDVDPRVQRYAAVQDSSIKDILGFHQEHIKGQPKLISIVGDMSKMDMERLKKLGEVREVPLDALFVE